MTTSALVGFWQKPSGDDPATTEYCVFEANGRFTTFTPATSATGSRNPWVTLFYRYRVLDGGRLFLRLLLADAAEIQCHFQIETTSESESLLLTRYDVSPQEWQWEKLWSEPPDWLVDEYYDAKARLDRKIAEFEAKESMG